jgi:hypothetical protein
MCATEHLAEPMLGTPFSTLTVGGTNRPVRNPLRVDSGNDSERCDEAHLKWKSDRIGLRVAMFKRVPATATRSVQVLSKLSGDLPEAGFEDGLAKRFNMGCSTEIVVTISMSQPM